MPWLPAPPRGWDWPSPSQPGRIPLGLLQEEKVREAAAGLGAKGLQVEAAALDISDSRAVRKFFEALVGSQGRIDILVNNAGSRQSVAEVAELGDREWDRVLGVILTGTFLRSAAAAMQRLFAPSSTSPRSTGEPGRPGGGLQCRQGGRDQPDPDAGSGVGPLRGAGQRREPRAGLHGLQPAEYGPGPITGCLGGGNDPASPSDSPGTLGRSP